MDKKINVLLVDDDKQITKSARLYLKEFNLHTCNSVEQALEVLDKENIEVIVTDYNMPGMTGIDFKQELEARDVMCPVIVMSGQMDKAVTMKFANLHIFYIFEKPFLFDDMADKIKEAYLVFSQNQSNKKFVVLGKTTGQIMHDLNNNISVIAMSSEVGLNLAQEEIAKKQFMGTLGSCEKINEMVGRYKKFLNNKEDISFSDVLVKNYFRTLVDEMNQKHINLEGVLPESSKISVDKILLNQVFLNLVNNSNDAMKDLDEKNITFSVTESVYKITIKIKDSGNGMPEHIKNKVFEEGNSSKGENGTGMGLSYCKKIVELHLGSISLEETGKNGTVFKIELPKVKE